LPAYALAFAASVTKDMPPEVAEAYGELYDNVAANDTRPNRVAPAVKGRSRSGGSSKTSGHSAPDASPDTQQQGDSVSAPPSGAETQANSPGSTPESPQTQQDQNGRSVTLTAGDQDWRDDHALDMAQGTEK